MDGWTKSARWNGWRVGMWAALWIGTIATTGNGETHQQLDARAFRMPVRCMYSGHPLAINSLRWPPPPPPPPPPCIVQSRYGVFDRIRRYPLQKKKKKRRRRPEQTPGTTTEFQPQNSLGLALNPTRSERPTCYHPTAYALVWAINAKATARGGTAEVKINIVGSRGRPGQARTRTGKSGQVRRHAETKNKTWHMIQCPW